MKTMKQKSYLGAALSVTLLSLMSFEAFATQVTTGGEFRLRSEVQSRRAWSTGKALGYSNFRVRPHLGWSPITDMNVFVQPQVTRDFGGNTNAASDPTYTDIGIGVHQAYLSFSPCDKSTVTLGRQELYYGDGIVIGRDDWHSVGRSFEGAKINYNMNKYWVDFLAMKNRNNLTLDRRLDDSSLYGIYTGWRYNLPLAKEIDVYYLAQTFAAGAGSYQNNIGARIVSSWGQWDYRVEDTHQWASFKDGKSNLLDAEVGYTFPSKENFRLAGGFFSGQENYTALFPSSHDHLGQMDIVGRTNVVGFRGRFSAAYNNRTRVKAEYFHFNRNHDRKNTTAADGSLLGVASASTSDLIGQEFDLALSYDTHKWMTWDVGASLFTPGGYLKQQPTTTVDPLTRQVTQRKVEEDAWYVFVQTTAKF